MWLLRKFVSLIAVLFAVSFLTFMLTQLLPGDPATAILGPAATPERIAIVEEDLGLDKPLPEQYLDWLGGVLTGDFGRAYSNNQPVADSIKDRLPTTLELLIVAQVLALIVAVPIAIFSAYRRNGAFDKVATGGAFTMLSIPNFVLAIYLITVFAVNLDWVPASGYTKFSDDPVKNIQSIILPSVALAIGLAAVYIRLLRSDMIATLQEDFILMARSQGLSPRRILFRHALRPSSFSLITVVGINVGALIGGSVIMEIIFALPGIGTLMLQSIGRRDYLVVQGVVLIIATGYVVANFVVDILYSVLDPRIRHARRAS